MQFGATMYQVADHDLANTQSNELENKMGILITGGTGFVGQELIKRFPDVTATSRNRGRALEKLKNAEVIEWDPLTQPIPLKNGGKFDAVINLMGESIAEGRWNAKKKKRIRESRVQGTRNLVDGILNSGHLPNVFISASAIGFYGDSGEDVVDESHPPGEGYLTDVCTEWEAEALKLQAHGVRVVCLRIGIVLGGKGGALEKMLPIFRMGLGGKLGSGQQWMAWIHVDDLVSMIEWAIKNESVSGPINGTAPNPVRNKTFTKALASAVRRPAFLPAPKFGLRLALGEFADSLFFSQNVVPEVALQNGFQFKFPEIRNAIEDVVGNQ